jgi:hypothetical protein
VDEGLRVILSAVLQEWEKLNSRLRIEEIWRDIFRRGIILDLSSRKHLNTLDELYTQIRDREASGGNELTEFLNQADWGLEVVEAIVGDRQDSDDASQDESENHASGSEAGSTVRSSHTNATLRYRSCYNKPYGID